MCFFLKILWIFWNLPVLSVIGLPSSGLSVKFGVHTLTIRKAAKDHLWNHSLECISIFSKKWTPCIYKTLPNFTRGSIQPVHISWSFWFCSKKQSTFRTFLQQLQMVGFFPNLCFIFYSILSHSLALVRFMKISLTICNSITNQKAWVKGGTMLFAWRMDTKVWALIIETEFA